MVELVRHHPTKGAATDMFEPKATASHLNSTKNRQTVAGPIALFVRCTPRSDRKCCVTANDVMCQ